MNSLNTCPLSVALLVISDRVSRKERRDGVESAVRAFLDGKNVSLDVVGVVPDEKNEIASKIVEWVDRGNISIILTAGGTGVSPRDVTPEATRDLLEIEIPGIPEAMRAESLKKAKNAPLSRALAGIRSGVMIVNLPGSPRAAVENLLAVFDAIVHGAKKAKGDMSDCALQEDAV